MKKLEEKIKYVDNNMYHYAIYALVNEYNPVLRQETPLFDFSNPPMDPKHLAISLLETMVKHYGVGLAATQVGFPYRVFAMGAGNVGFACFNPEVLETEGEDKFKEGCLTTKGLFLDIKRSKNIKVRFTDMNGIIQEKTFEGLTARTFLHELDHLNGILYTDLVHPLNLEKAKRKIKSNLKKLKIQEENFEKQKIIAQATKNVVEDKKIILNTENTLIKL